MSIALVSSKGKMGRHRLRLLAPLTIACTRIELRFYTGRSLLRVAPNTWYHKRSELGAYHQVELLNKNVEFHERRAACVYNFLRVHRLSTVLSFGCGYDTAGPGSLSGILRYHARQFHYNSGTILGPLRSRPVFQPREERILQQHCLLPRHTPGTARTGL